ncbi:FHA domain-containing protein [Cellulomonas sp. ATA003]|uniref:FHA domain-containing protein n=1 Tax=Cellulomonas sp. ATA003 TaxID=3073064 RepID=UPI002873B200|nr:FHA domain-containing protein [Cellulomonas sp. ATA003]WNB85973.1 FHA domain-containing protein [Cellulomonas sp. ATA003]
MSGAPTVATPTTPAAPTGPAAPTDPATAPVPVAAPAPRPAAPVDRPHGPWVELALSDGRTVTVAGSALLGRDPVPRAGETPGTLVTMDDPERAVSKTHLAVGVDASGAWVVDRRSTNGTVVTLEDGQQIICVPEERVRLSEGVAVGFGGHSFAVTALAPAGGPDPR